MRKLWILALVAVLCSCRLTKEEVDNSVVISMQKTKCYGSCPEYTLDIYESGKVYFSGIENVDKIGEYQIKLSRKELQRLVSLFVSSNFFEFKDRYVSDASDLPTTYLYFSHNGKRKRITDYDGAPKTLKFLEEEVSQLVSIPKWKQMKKPN